MIYEANYQFYIFLNALYAGVLAALTYDVFTFLFFGKSKKNLFKDIIFWIVCIIMTLYFLLVRTDLFFRGYILFGILSGWILYILVFSRLIRKILFQVNDKTALGLKKTANVTKKGIVAVKRSSAPLTNRIKKFLSIPFFEIKIYNKFKNSIKKGKAYEKQKKKKKIQ
jgi:spore cortex biosynthesis protein YabQ